MSIVKELKSVRSKKSYLKADKKAAMKVKDHERFFQSMKAEGVIEERPYGISPMDTLGRVVIDLHNTAQSPKNTNSE